jgi:5-methyltetrahydrofolate--homocysteine methyltransferase
MKRLNFKTPLLIGGATTSKKHTAVKIHPEYDGPVVHVLDASRAVDVANKILHPVNSRDFMQKTNDDMRSIRQVYESSKGDTKLIPIEQARLNKFNIRWSKTEIAIPKKTGIKIFDNYPLNEIKDYIDWAPFFSVWELKGAYPAILKNEQARQVFDDANKMLQDIVSSEILTAKAVTGIFPANSVGDDIEIYSDKDADRQIATVFTLRQQMERRNERANFALADFIAPKETGFKDYIGAFAVTTGIGLEQIVDKFEKDHDDYNSIMAKAVADRLAEAFAELLHRKIRLEIWGYARDENLNTDDLVKEKFRGIRPAPGYPACPDHTQKTVLFELLDATGMAGIKLTESMAMLPAASVSGWYFAHPQSQYFGLGKIGIDQLHDYARRRGIPLKEAEKWLSPNLV